MMTDSLLVYGLPLALIPLPLCFFWLYFPLFPSCVSPLPDMVCQLVGMKAYKGTNITKLQNVTRKSEAGLADRWLMTGGVLWLATRTRDGLQFD